MPINGEFAIFRCTTVGQTEATTVDKVEFDAGAVIPDGRSKIISFNPVMSRTETQNSAPFLELARKPDTGFSGNRYTIRIFFDESVALAAGLGRLIQWYSQENALPGAYKNGRFGVRNNYRPELDLTPDNTAGYKFVHLDISQDLKISRVIIATVILEFSGDPSRLRVNRP